MNILIVEDSIVEATLFVEELKRAIDGPVKILHADTLGKAVGMLKESRKNIDIMFLDLGLPDSNDWRQTYEAISPYTDHLPVIVMTSNKNPEIIEELLEHGFQDYIIKGGKKQDIDLLKETVKFALLRHKVVDQMAGTLEEKKQCVKWLTGGYSME